MSIHHSTRSGAAATAGQSAIAGLALALVGTALGCTSGSSISDSGGGASAPQVMTVTGALTGSVGGATGKVDYSGLPVKAVLTHKISQDASVPACVPLISLAVEKPDGTCRLELEFKPGISGSELELAAVKFTAKQAVKQGVATVGTVPCVGWVEEPKKDEVIYQLESGSATMPMPTLAFPQAGQDQALIKGLDLRPTGKVLLKVAGQARKFEFDLAALRFAGDAASTGSSDAALECKKTTFPMPNWSLKDINAASATHDKVLNLNSDFKLKRVVVLNGAGWCASCVSQTKSMEKLRAQLAAQGRDDVAFVTINSADAVQDQAKITEGVKVAVVQGTGSSGWQTMQRPDGKPGEKNDGFIFDYSGKLLGFFQGAGTVHMGVWEEWMAKNVGLPQDAGAGYNCKDGGAPGQFGQSCTKVDAGL